MCKTTGLDIYNNLLIMESKIKMISLNAEIEDKIYFSNQSHYLQEYFRSLTLFKEDKTIPLLTEQILSPLKLTVDERTHINSGKILIFVRDSKVFMISKLKKGMLVAEVRKDKIWWEEMPQTYILTSKNILLSEKAPSFNPDEYTLNTTGQFEYSDREESYIVSFWSIFLHKRFNTLNWTVVMSRSKSVILQPLQEFRKMFVLLCLLAFSIVLFLSIMQIRRSLIPIDILKKGTQKIAAGEFNDFIKIKSGDELEELGESFNEMSKELQEMQAMVVQTEKMKTIGQMSSAIVHEINQPLTAIKGYLSLIQELDNPSEEAKKYLAIVSKSVGRLTEIAAKFKRFSRKSDDEPLSVISLNDSVKNIQELLEHQLVKKKVELILNLEKGLPLIMGNENSLQQIFMNLAVNAIDAIEEENAHKENPHKARITISTCSNNNHVNAAVEDNGPGIPVEIREKIFEPFFTTKTKEKGTGLGLAVIKSIIKSHKGTMEIESGGDRGTRFSLTFPVAQS
jgi:C4-dicarboxylate-specific signal transduction histidine kinase